MKDFLNKLFSLDGKKAVVTGTRHGMGIAFKRALEGAGADVFSFGRSDGYDVTDDQCIERVIGEQKRVDILVNCAGITSVSWEKTYAVNLRGPYKMCEAVRSKMKAGASIINITSINAERGFPGNPQYVTMKQGLRGLTMALAVDYAPAGIRVNAIGPGYFRTDMTTKSWNDEKRRDLIAEKTLLGRWGEPEELMGALLYLASGASSYVTGQTLYVDGGWLIKGI